MSPASSSVAVSDQFPAGLRVLVVDDDPTCLRILEKMLRICLYEGTIQASFVMSCNFICVFLECFFPFIRGFLLHVVDFECSSFVILQCLI